MKERYQIEEEQKPIIEKIIKCSICRKERMIKIPIRAYKILVYAKIGLPDVCEECYRKGELANAQIILRPMGVKRDE